MDKIFEIIRLCVNFIETFVEAIINVKKNKEEQKWEEQEDVDYNVDVVWEEVVVFVAAEW